MDKTRACYDYYNSRFGYEPKRAGVWRAVAQYLAPFISPKSCVLDMGAGYCGFINCLDAAEKHALDIFPKFVQFADSDVQTHVGDCSDLSIFGTGYFDVVLASNLLEHLTREALLNTLSETSRVLKSSGRFIIIQPNYRYCYWEYFDDYTHLQIFSHISLADLLKAHGFTIERIEQRFLPFSFKSCLPKWPWIVKLYLRMPIRPFAKQMLIVARV